MNIFELAKQCDMDVADEAFGAIITAEPADLERFAALVLEEAAKVCEARYVGDNNREDMEARRCAAAIRQLKEKT